jgi:outer membrane receptor for ferrienterochelin and colicin
MNSSERKYAQGKLTWRVTPVIKASINYIHDYNPVRSYDGFNDRFRYFFNPDGFGTHKNLSNTVIFQLSHTVGSRTFYTVGASYFEKNVRYHVYEDPHDPRYTHPALFTDFLGAYSFYTGGTDLNRFRRSTITKLGKFDISSQFGESNLVKLGVEYRRHRVFYENYDLQPVQAQAAFDPFTSSPFLQTQIPPQSSSDFSTYTHRPTEYSAYIQDKLEFKDFILNVGVRFDYFEPDGVVLNDESDPNIYAPIKPNNRFFDLNGNGRQDSGEATKTVDDRRAYWYKKTKAKYQFSPRIGASFPITARGVVHFSYGHFFQTPRFERLYENPDFQFASGTGNLGVVGNADLEPEQTINGEIGIQQQITDDISVDVTAYLRDIRNLTTTGADEIIIFGGSAKYSKYQNRDFGFVKGIVLTIDKRFSHGLSATLDYTYQIARGSGSDPQETRNALTAGKLPEVQLTPLSWDQRHTLNVTMSYSAKNWGASFISQYGSGTPYTPRSFTDITALLTNSQDKPPFFNVDVRAFYEIPIDPIRIVTFVRVFNVFDTRNENEVFDDTGRAGFTTDEAKALSENTPELVNSVQDYFLRPRFYSEPRRIEIGMNLEF